MRVLAGRDGREMGEGREKPRDIVYMHEIVKEKYLTDKKEVLVPDRQEMRKHGLYSMGDRKQCSRQKAVTIY